ncbi:MAG: type II secretion system F family protein [Phototrophicaceae bacterium]|jgi:tight adherence protein C
MLIGIGIVVAIVVIGVFVYIGLRDEGDRDPLQERLAEFGEREVVKSLEEIELSLSFRDRVVLPLLKALADITRRFTPEEQIEETRRKLELAGMSGQIEPSVFFVLRIVAAVVLAIIAFFVFFVFSSTFPAWQATIGLALFTAFGFFLPILYIGSKISRRQNDILKALPDALDLLVICVEAGLGFDAAMGKVYEKWDNELSISFGRVLREIQLGKGRREALKDMSNRMDVPDVTSFVAAIIQADSLGVPMSKILRVQSDQMRTKRRQRAQEKAHQAPVKMMVPMVMLIFPSIWIVLLGPAVLGVMTSGALDAF